MGFKLYVGLCILILTILNSAIAGSIDVHMHFCHKSIGAHKSSHPSDTIDFTTCADETIKLMDKHRVDKAVIIPPPMLKDQRGFYSFDSLLSAVQKYPDRLYLGAGGSHLNAMIHEIPANNVNGAIKRKFRAEALRVVNAGAVAFGEMAALHISMDNNEVFEEVSPDHPLFFELADISAEHNIPINIHMEPILKYTPTPPNLRNVSRKNPSYFKMNICAFEHLLEHNRDAVIVWQHIGWDNVGQMTVDLLERMIRDNPNLYLGYKVESRLNQVCSNKPMRNRMVDENLKFKPEWLELMTKYPDRFLVATDQSIASSIDKAHTPSYLKETWTPTRELPPDIFKMVARENALRLYTKLNQ